MFLSIKKLSQEELALCRKTIGPKAFFALVGDALARKENFSVVRAADGELRLLNTPEGAAFDAFEKRYPGWNARYGIDGLEIKRVKENILTAGNTCTYFAPSVSGISRDDYKLYHLFEAREVYADNFFVNDWTPEMLRLLIEAAGGAFIIHKNYEELIHNFSTHYDLPAERFAGFPKQSWRDNDEAIRAASASEKQLVLFSAGPAGKLIGPAIAESGKVVLDVGNTLPNWSIGNPHAYRAGAVGESPSERITKL